jgi:phosphohistidine phosphatase SixA
MMARMWNITLGPGAHSGQLGLRQILLFVLACIAGIGPLAQASELADRLRSDNHVLLIRHAYAPGVGDPPGYSLERCDTQRVLNEQGRAQARRIGHWLKAQGVERAEVHTSVWCRCRQTAEGLELGPVSVEPSLASFFDQPQRAAAQNRALQAFVAKALRIKQGQALILVTHHVNIREFMGRDIGSGDLVLVRVDAQGRALDHRHFPSP